MDRGQWNDQNLALGEPLPACCMTGTLCTLGITNSDGSVCCAKSCGVCGGCDCALNPGGADLCCPGTIAAAGLPCMSAVDTGCLLATYVPVGTGLCE